MSQVYAAETGDQLTRYNKVFEELSCKGGVLFITTDGRPPVSSELHSKVATVSWKRLSRAFMRQVDKMPKSYGAMTIRQFCEHVAKF
jgi:hypothetical protein